MLLVDTQGLGSGLSIHRRAVVLPGRTPGHPRGRWGAFRWLQLVLEQNVGPWSTLESSVTPRGGSKLKEVSPGGL